MSHIDVTRQVRAFVARGQAERRAIEEAKHELAGKHVLVRDAKFEHAWQLAWDYGHASGLDEVKNYFDDLAELIRPAVKCDKPWARRAAHEIYQKVATTAMTGGGRSFPIESVYEEIINRHVPDELKEQPVTRGKRRFSLT